jgi:ribosomal protein L40E
MKCGHCGSDLPEDSIYCLACGRKVGDEQSSVVSYATLPFGTTIACPKCGAKNSRTDRWCGSCDADLDYAKRQRTSTAPGGPNCPKCGVSSPADSWYCRKCGASLRPVPVDTTISLPSLTVGDTETTHQHEIIVERQVIMVRCKYCGTLNGPTAVRCSSCGATM